MRLTGMVVIDPLSHPQGWLHLVVLLDLFWWDERGGARDDSVAPVGIGDGDSGNAAPRQD